jgi:hypothetical protein
MTRITTRGLFAIAAIASAIPRGGIAQESVALGSLREALTFAASFDTGTNAEFAKGDRRVYHASSGDRKDPKPGLVAGEVEVAKGAGRLGGDALRFRKKSNRVVFYRAAGNVDYRKTDWSGTVSFWLSLDPEKDLEPGYCDPIQITEKAWNDAGLWVDFSKDETPRHFRLGAFADLKVWNPTNRDFEKLPEAEKPMSTVTRPPFGRGKWTHVAITFERFNTGKSDGLAKLYLDGAFQGAVSGRDQTWSWDVERAAIQLGLSYVGLFDDLTIFRRALSDAEIRTLHGLRGRLGAP